MITAIIETRDDEVALARLLAALVPAATEGIVREVIVVDHGSRDGTLEVADTAGCTIVSPREGGGDPLQAAAESARGDWLLFLSPRAVLLPGWLGSAMDFIDRAMIAGHARSRIAIVRRGLVADGLLARALNLFSAGEGRLIAKSAYLAASALSPSAASLASGVRRGAA